MKTINLSQGMKLLFVLGIFSITTFIAYGVVTTSGGVFKSTPYQTRNASADEKLSQLTNGTGPTILDGVVAKIKAKATEKGGSPVDVAKYNAYIDSRLTAMDALDNEVRAELGSDYTFIFEYVYPRVYGLKKEENKIASVLERLQSTMGADDTTFTTSQTSGNQTSTSSGTSVSVATTANDACKKEMKFGNLQICDTGKQAIYKEINTLCPSGFHVPNYWEMAYIIQSGVPLNLVGSYYYIASLYRDTNENPDYPYFMNPYVLRGNSLNHEAIGDTTTVNGQPSATYGKPVYGISNTQKGDVLCITSSGVPTSSSNGNIACKLESSLYSTGVSGNYTSQTIKRPYLFIREEFSLTSSGTDVYKGNIDYTLNLSCDPSGKILKTEKIAKVNSCKYGYILKNNDCVVDETICNLENLGNVHSANSKVCSWKEIGTEEIKGTEKFLNNSIGDQRSAAELANTWDATNKKTFYTKYREKYNNKIDIKMECQVERIDDKTGTWGYTMNYKCIADGLFWQ